MCAEQMTLKPRFATSSQIPVMIYPDCSETNFLQFAHQFDTQNGNGLSDHVLE